MQRGLWLALNASTWDWPAEVLPTLQQSQSHTLLRDRERGHPLNKNHTDQSHTEKFETQSLTLLWSHINTNHNDLTEKSLKLRLWCQRVILESIGNDRNISFCLWQLLKHHNYYWIISILLFRVINDMYWHTPLSKKVSLNTISDDIGLIIYQSFLEKKLLHLEVHPIIYFCKNILGKLKLFILIPKPSKVSNSGEKFLSLGL